MSGVSNHKSKYRNDILRLRQEGKKYREISQELNCTMSTVSYHLLPSVSLWLKDNRIPSDKKKPDYKKRNKDIVVEYLRNHPCVDCGNSDIRVLDFDHVREEKEGNISNAVRDAWPVDRLMAEIEKCDIRCANCHRIATFERRIINTKHNS